MKDPQWWISELPRVLMASASILLERLFRMTKPRRQSPSAVNRKDRVMVQVLLWLTASLPSGSESSHRFEALLYAVFFANLMGIIGPSLVSGPTRYASYGQPNSDGAIRRRGTLGRCFPKARSETTWNGATAGSGTFHQEKASTHPWNLESFLQRVAPSLWISLVLSYLEHGNYTASEIEATYRYFGLAGAVLLGSSFFAWWMHHYQSRKQQRRQYLPDLAMSLSTPRMEEHHWYEWTVSQVGEWLSQGVEGIQEEEDLQDLTAKLAWERVDGATLDSLNMDALRHMEVPYGVAVRLLEHVKVRLRRYPRPSRYTENDVNLSPEVDTDYQFSSLDSRPAAHIRQPFLDDEELEQARSSMMQRFGFPLPELPKGKPEDSSEPSHEKPRTHEQVPDKTRANAAHGTTSLDDALLSSMPPHLRAIVQRKPHLWQQAQATNAQQKNTLESKTGPQQAATPPPNAAASSSLSKEDPQTPQTANETSPASSIPASILQNLPPKVREVADRNPALFWKMFNAKQQQPQQAPHPTHTTPAAAASLPIVDEAAEYGEEGNDEMTQLLPKLQGSSSAGLLRQRPGF